MFGNKKSSYRRKIADINRALHDPTSLGNLLLKTRIITDQQLDEACRFQWKNDSMKLGEALVKLGLLEHEVLEVVIEEQKRVRSRGTEKSRAVMEQATKTVQDVAAVGTSLESLGDLILQIQGKLK